MFDAFRRARFLIVAPTRYEWDLAAYVETLLHAQGLDCRVFTYLTFKNDAEANAQLLVKARQYRPDFVLGLKLERITPQTLQTLRERGTRVVLWYVDCFTAQVPMWLKPLLGHVDLFLTTAQGMVYKYQALTDAPVQWLYEGVYLPAFPPRVLSAAERRAYASEVAFIGGIFQPPVRNPQLAQRRLKLLTRLGERFDLRVWGPQARVPRKTNFRVTRWLAYHDEVVKICGAAAIVLGINTVNTVALYFSNRTFLTLASGGFHLTEYVPQLEALFENKRHLVWYHSDAECVELAAYYLKHPTARARIAAQGRQFTRAHYGMRRQLYKMLKWIAAL